jgi:hypothetical protein
LIDAGEHRHREPLVSACLLELGDQDLQGSLSS